VKFSVVMAVFNGGPALQNTLESISGQTERDFELIVVDDGSTDETAEILANYRDPRLRVISQENVGLTRSLIRGCDAARAPLIARHDSGDRSHPERFARQLALLEDGHVLVGCAARFLDDDGDLLYESREEGTRLRENLVHADADGIHALPHHGTALFRREAYVEAGGYRAEFRFAQDLDLWIRMARLGSIGIVDDILYEALFTPRSISGGARDAQRCLTEIAVRLRDGGDRSTLLAEAALVTSAPPTAERETAALYFIGKCLLAQGNDKGQRLLRDVLARNPWHWRARLSLWRSGFRQRSG
jgi:glycosyltransferase involved in cell wall biosynthesis